MAHRSESSSAPGLSRRVLVTTLACWTLLLLLLYLPEGQGAAIRRAANGPPAKNSYRVNEENEIAGVIGKSDRMSLKRPARYAWNDEEEDDEDDDYSWPEDEEDGGHDATTSAPEEADDDETKKATEVNESEHEAGGDEDATADYKDKASGEEKDEAGEDSWEDYEDVEMGAKHSDEAEDVEHRTHETSEGPATEEKHAETDESDEDEDDPISNEISTEKLKSKPEDGGFVSPDNGSEAAEERSDAEDEKESESGTKSGQESGPAHKSEHESEQEPKEEHESEPEQKLEHESEPKSEPETGLELTHIAPVHSGDKAVNSSGETKESAEETGGGTTEEDDEEWEEDEHKEEDAEDLTETLDVSAEGNEWGKGDEDVAHGSKTTGDEGSGGDEDEDDEAQEKHDGEGAAHHASEKAREHRLEGMIGVEGSGDASEAWDSDESEKAGNSKELEDHHYDKEGSGSEENEVATGVVPHVEAENEDEKGGEHGEKHDDDKEHEEEHDREHEGDDDGKHEEEHDEDHVHDDDDERDDDDEDDEDEDEDDENDEEHEAVKDHNDEHDGERDGKNLEVVVGEEHEDKDEDHSEEQEGKDEEPSEEHEDKNGEHGVEHEGKDEENSEEHEDKDEEHDEEHDDEDGEHDEEHEDKDEKHDEEEDRITTLVSSEIDEAEGSGGSSAEDSSSGSGVEVVPEVGSPDRDEGSGSVEGESEEVTEAVPPLVRVVNLEHGRQSLYSGAESTGDTEGGNETTGEVDHADDEEEVTSTEKIKEGSEEHLTHSDEDSEDPVAVPSEDQDEDNYSWPESEEEEKGGDHGPNSKENETGWPQAEVETSTQKSGIGLDHEEQSGEEEEEEEEDLEWPDSTEEGEKSEISEDKSFLASEYDELPDEDIPERNKTESEEDPFGLKLLPGFIAGIPDKVLKNIVGEPKPGSATTQKIPQSITDGGQNQNAVSSQAKGVDISMRRAKGVPAQQAPTHPPADVGPQEEAAPGVGEAATEKSGEDQAADPFITWIALGLVAIVFFGVLGYVYVRGKKTTASNSKGPTKNGRGPVVDEEKPDVSKDVEMSLLGKDKKYPPPNYYGDGEYQSIPLEPEEKDVQETEDEAGKKAQETEEKQAPEVEVDEIVPQEAEPLTSAPPPVEEVTPMVKVVATFSETPKPMTPKPVYLNGRGVTTTQSGLDGVSNSR